MNACATIRPHTLDELLFWAPSLLRTEWLSDWERGFVASMLRASRRRNWTPSAKQERTLRRLVDTLFTDASLIEDDASVIDDGD